MIEPPWACPACLGPLDEGAGALRCPRCGRRYDVIEGVPRLLADVDAAAIEQAHWFDHDVDEEYEISRPHGAPALHGWLLGEKFRRSTAGLELRGANVLSVCAGSGMDAEFLARAGARVTAVDISPGAATRTLERSRRAGLGIAAVVGDAAALPFPDQSFDVAYVHDGLHHVPDPAAALAEMARVSRSAVSVTEPADALFTRVAVRLGLALEREEAGNRVARLAPEAVAGELRRLGFRILRAERYAMYYKHEPRLAARVLSRPVVLGLAKAANRLGNVVLGRFGNKMVVVAVRR